MLRATHQDVGLKLRLNLFEGVAAPDVYGALTAFYAKRGAALAAEPDRWRRYELHHRQGRWCVLDWDGGWEWKQRREAQLFVSMQLHTTGLLVFAFDGEYWGYELLRDGEVVDRFLQNPSAGATWFPGDPCDGNASVLARELGLSEHGLAPYLVQQPTDSDPDQADWRELDLPARSGDEFGRFHECAVVDFLRAIGVQVEVSQGYVRMRSEVWRSFRPRFG